METNMSQEKAIVITIILVGLAVTGVWVYSDRTARQEFKPVTEAVENIPIETFSMNCTVLKVENDQFTFKTGTVQKTAEGNKWVEQEKVVHVTANTILASSDPSAKLSITDLIVGMTVTVLTKSNPFKISEITADKVLIQ